jgi:ribose transport system permease protein/L-arabinose transport system permease protein
MTQGTQTQPVAGPTVGARIGGALKQVLRSEQAGLLIALVLLFVLLTVLAPSKFLRPVNMLNIVLAISVTGLAAIAQTVIMISGGLDVSISAIVGLASVVAAIAVKATDSWVIGVIAGMVTGLLAGAVNGTLVTVGRINPVITTLATVSVFSGLAYLVTGGQAVGVSNDVFNMIGNGRLLGIPIPVFILIAVFAVMAIFLARTDLGRNYYALGGNPNAARLAGIYLDRYRMAVYMLGGIICGLAAVISTGRTNSGIPTTTQTDLNFQAITAAVLGGTALAGGKGTLWGTMLGVLIIGTLSNGMVILGVPIFYQMLARGLLLIFAVLLQTRRTGR